MKRGIKKGDRITFTFPETTGRFRDSAELFPHAGKAYTRKVTGVTIFGVPEVRLSGMRGVRIMFRQIIDPPWIPPTAEEFKETIKSVIQNIERKIEFDMLKKGDRSEDCQKTYLLQTLKTFEYAVNGTTQEDIKPQQRG